MKSFSVSSVSFVLSVLAFQFTAFAQPAWTLTTADFNGRQVDLVSIDEKGANVADKQGTMAGNVSWNQLLLIERATQVKAVGAGAGGKFVLRLIGGDQLRGEPVKIENEALHW